ncbi:hypothetical protein DPMN_113091 [Dreissena polymorpha]|uniref:Uncharacterized protein n=1 Tax=Dreissena polymorpha TaxID=45954 RepID=A0A9D4KHT0_DREPO|nr:hypothetical protein DPMN_113091 [Dreissena polymorpha]
MSIQLQCIFYKELLKHIFGYTPLKDIPSGSKLGADGIEYVWTDSDIFPSELCIKFQVDKTNQDEDENDESIEIDNLLDEVFDEQ